MESIQWLDWPAPKSVKACYTLRNGGLSLPPYDSFNMGDHVGDKLEHVQSNRHRLSDRIGQSEICWLQQVHGVEVHRIEENLQAFMADASTTVNKGKVCSVMTADCLPVFFCDQSGSQVAVAHAGWRGLLDGVLQATVKTFKQPSQVMAYLGPAISQAAFEVGDEVRLAFIEKNSALAENFIPSKNNNKWMADLYGMARTILQGSQVTNIYGGNHCTYSEDQLFFSYRREGVTGRMANVIWLE